MSRSAEKVEVGPPLSHYTLAPTGKPGGPQQGYNPQKYLSPFREGPNDRSLLPT